MAPGHAPAPAGDLPPGAVLDELRAREPLFHPPPTRADFLAQTSDDFWEIGASGRRYDREHVWSVLAARHAEDHGDEWSATGFRCRDVGAGTYLLTYTLDQGGRTTRRLTVWRRAAHGWQALYHQGTLVTDP